MKLTARQKLDNLMDALGQDILEMTDEEILAEASEEDMRAVEEKMRCDMNEQDLLDQDSGYQEWLNMMDQAWWTRMEEQLEESTESDKQ